MSKIDAVAYAIARVIARKAIAEVGGPALPYLAQEKRLDEMAREMIPDLIHEATAAIEAVTAFGEGAAKPDWMSQL